MKNQLKTIFLLGVLSAVLIAIGGALGKGYLYGALVLAAVLNLGSYFFSDRIVLRIHRAQEIPEHQLPWLHAIVAELAARAGIPKPRVFLIPEAQPNAFATGRNPAHGVVAVTSGILELLDQRELRGVLAHELAHVSNRDVLISSIAATVAAAVTYLAHAVGFFGSMFLGRGDDDEGGVSGAQALLLMLVAPLAATLIQLGISRSREFHADQTGARLCGDPEALASALEKLHRGAQVVHPRVSEPATASLFIVNPFSSGQRLLSLFSTHPDMEERVRRLRGMARAGAPAYR